MTELAIRPDQLIAPDSLEAMIGAVPLDGLLPDNTQQYGAGASPADMPLERHDAPTALEVDMEDRLAAAYVREALEAEPDRTIFSLRVRPNGSQLVNELFSQDYMVNPGNGTVPVAATGLLETSPDNRMILPPAAADLAIDYDLAELANKVVSEETTHIEDGREIHTLPPFLSPTDAIMATTALTDPAIENKLIQEYGIELYETALKKAVAMREANIAETYTWAKDIVRQYNRLRQGSKPDDTIPIIFPERLPSVADSVTEPPLHEVVHEPLVFNAEGLVVLSALRQAAFRRKGNPNQIGALEVLSRYEPSEKLRKVYGNLLKQFVDIRPEIVKNAPEYSYRRS
jgi:hypothetical protein